VVEPIITSVMQPEINAASVGALHPWQGLPSLTHWRSSMKNKNTKRSAKPLRKADSPLEGQLRLAFGNTLHRR